MKIVCDTNVLIAGLVAEGLCRDIVKRRLLVHQLFSSEILLAELEEKLVSKFDVVAGDIPFLRAYKERVEIVSTDATRESVCRDPDDDEVLAAAVAAKADVIITGDKDLLILKSHRGTKILSPREFVELADQ